MNSIRISIRALAISASLTAASSASAQCLQWESTFATQGFNGAVNALAVHRPCDGGEPSLYAGGSFSIAGGVAAARVARWNGSVWSPVGAGLPGFVTALCVYDDGRGNGPELYAAGHFGLGACSHDSLLARWDGATWTMICDPDMIGGGDSANALAVYEGQLYIGGLFDVVIAGNATSDILRYDGVNLTAVGTGIRGGSFFHRVESLCVFDSGSGLKLVAGGEFTFPANNVASWNGSSWSAFGSGVGGFMNAAYSVGAFDSGSGPEVYAGGSWGVLRWNGSTWQSFGGGVSGRVDSLYVYGDGSNPASLYAGGTITSAGGNPAGRIARWDGAAWFALGTGFDLASGTTVLAMTSFDDHLAGGSDLYAGGVFATAGGVSSPNIAEWSGCGNLTGTAFCFGDGSLAAPCPCALPDTVPNPPAALRHGCANSFNLDGAQLFGRGSTGLDNVVLTTSGQSPVAFGFFLVGTAQDSGGVASADGVRCVDGALTRFGSQYAVCGSVKYPNAAAGWTTPLSVVSGTTPGSGLSKYYQVYYRNAAASFCTGATTNWTSGYRLDW